MTTITITGIAELRATLEGFSDRRFESAMAEALNRTARHVADVWGGQMATKFDRPTAMTYRAARVSERADVGRLTAEVSLRDTVPNSGIAPSEYVLTHEQGASDRRMKKFERALVAGGAMLAGHKVVPGKHAKLDQFGNISRGQIVAVLNQLGDALSEGYQQVISRNAAKRAFSAAKRGRRYVPVPRAIGKLEAGVYERKDNLLLPVFFFVSSTRYRKSISLMETGAKAAEQVIRAEINRAIDKRLASLRLRTQR